MRRDTCGNSSLCCLGGPSGCMLAALLVSLLAAFQIPLAAAQADEPVRPNPFVFAPIYPVSGLNPSSIAVGDFNGDGSLDFVTGNSGIYEYSVSTTISVFLGNGNGAFAPAVNYDTGCTPSDVAAADINGDGKLDIVVADQFPGNPCNHPGITVYLGNGGWDVSGPDLQPSWVPETHGVR